VVSRICNKEVWRETREEFSLPSTSGWKALFAFMRLTKEGLDVVGVIGDAGMEREVGEAASSSVLWSLGSVVLVQEDEAEELLLLREGGWRAFSTKATSAVVRASPPLSALIRFFAFLRSRFLSFGVVSGSSSAVQEKGLLLLGEKGEAGQLLGSRP
jgi:hypothetical protein